MRTKIIVFLLSFYLPCLGQVAIDNDCGFRSCRIFGRVVLTVLGLNTVREMLEHNQRLTLWLNIDSLGYVLSVKKAGGEMPQPQHEEAVSKLKSYFQQNMVQMPICYALLDLDRTYEEQLKLAIESFRESGPRTIIAFFPGELPLRYEMAKNSGYKGSMLDYLLLKLNEQEIPIKKKVRVHEKKDIFVEP